MKKYFFIIILFFNFTYSFTQDIDEEHYKTINDKTQRIIDEYTKFSAFTADNSGKFSKEYAKEFTKLFFKGEKAIIYNDINYPKFYNDPLFPVPMSSRLSVKTYIETVKSCYPDGVFSIDSINVCFISEPNEIGKKDPLKEKFTHFVLVKVEKYFWGVYKNEACLCMIDSTPIIMDFKIGFSYVEEKNKKPTINNFKIITITENIETKINIINQGYENLLNSYTTSKNQRTTINIQIDSLQNELKKIKADTVYQKEIKKVGEKVKQAKEKIKIEAEEEKKWDKKNKKQNKDIKKEDED